jgi:hypothetical protein
MSGSVRFSANNVLDWYIEAENMLVGFLKYVPYCEEHKEVWSPKLVVILQETCSQLDSLWRWEAENVHGKKGQIDITEYFELYGEVMASRWVIFWSDEPRKINPFAAWQSADDFSKTNSNNYPLDWWKEGYQKIKHNRLENYRCATLESVVESLAGLFLAIIRFNKLWDSLWEKGWVSWDEEGGTPFDPADCLKADFGSKKDNGECHILHMAVESKLFTYPVGLGKGLITANYPHWKGNCNKRFKAWYDDYCQNLRDNQ